MSLKQGYVISKNPPKLGDTVFCYNSSNFWVEEQVEGSSVVYGKAIVESVLDMEILSRDLNIYDCDFHIVKNIVVMP